MQSALIGKYVVVRTYSAGVHAGILDARDGKEVRLKDSRRIWSWTAANSDSGALSGVAANGVGPRSKIGNTVSVIELTEAIEIIATTHAAESAIRAASWSGK